MERRITLEGHAREIQILSSSIETPMGVQSQPLFRSRAKVRFEEECHAQFFADDDYSVRFDCAARISAGCRGIIQHTDSQLHPNYLPREVFHRRQ
jgi:hypothetical protein